MRLEDIPAGGGIWYLASPYTNYAGGLDAACALVAGIAALAIKHGLLVFSPITHSHSISMAGVLDPKDAALWEAVDRPFLEASAGCIVVMLDGWQNSTGVSNEIRHFVEANKPIVYLEVGALLAPAAPVQVYHTASGSLDKDSPTP